MAVAQAGNATLTLADIQNHTVSDIYYCRQARRIGLNGSGGYGSTVYSCDCQFDNCYYGGSLGLYLQHYCYNKVYIFKSNGTTVCYKVSSSNFYKYMSGSSGPTYKLEILGFDPIFGTDECWSIYHNGTDQMVGGGSVSNYPTDYIETLIKQFFIVDNNEITKVGEGELPQWIAQNLFNYNLDPVYAPATQINYTDGSYEVIRNVLTEQQAKDHAYKNLLETYGSFYKANEVEINQSLNKVNP